MVKNYFVESSRKKARARATVKAGTGKIRINSRPLDVFYSKYKKMLVEEPIKLAEDEFKKLDFFIKVYGGGVIGQVQAIRSCIAKGIILASGKNKKAIKEKFLQYDRHLLTDDARQKEPKKQLGRGARKKKQHSKR